MVFWYVLFVLEPLLTGETAMRYILTAFAATFFAIPILFAGSGNRPVGGGLIDDVIPQFDDTSVDLPGEQFDPVLYDILATHHQENQRDEFDVRHKAVGEPVDPHTVDGLDRISIRVKRGQEVRYPSNQYLMDVLIPVIDPANALPGIMPPLSGSLTGG